MYYFFAKPFIYWLIWYRFKMHFIIKLRINYISIINTHSDIYLFRSHQGSIMKPDLLKILNLHILFSSVICCLLIIIGFWLHLKNRLRLHSLMSSVTWKSRSCFMTHTLRVYYGKYRTLCELHYEMGPRVMSHLFNYPSFSILLCCPHEVMHVNRYFKKFEFSIHFKNKTDNVTFNLENTRTTIFIK